MFLAAALPLFAFLAFQEAPCADSARAVGEAALPWVRQVEHLACENRRLAKDISHGTATLKLRAEAASPALVPRIVAGAPTPRPTGYALLPELTADAPEAAVPLTESRFSIATLLDASAAERRAAAMLIARAASDTVALEPMVRELERLKAQFRWLEGSVGYHRFWQKSAADASAFFAAKNILVARARQLRDLEQASRDTAAVAAFRRVLAVDIAPFVKTRSLAWHLDPSGIRVLPVEVVTDITDSAFLAQFERAVQRAWSDSPAARARQFRVALTLTRIAPAAVYPQGPPVVGTAINEAAHLARFPAGVLVLTTGGLSTHSYVGRYVQLGTASITPRVLAHEFGHLLGFEDGYLRGTEGDATAPFGFTIVEWTGILDDIMGAPGIGRVRDELIAQLVDAYNPARTETPRRNHVNP